MTTDRRHFTRLRISEQAIAFAEDGTRLGLVTEAGGGGMAITLDAEISPDAFAIGKLITIAIVEPHKDIRNCLRVEIRYVVRNVLGLAFVSSRAAHQ